MDFININALDILSAFFLHIIFHMYKILYYYISSSIALKYIYFRIILFVKKNIMHRTACFLFSDKHISRELIDYIRQNTLKWTQTHETISPISFQLIEHVQLKFNIVNYYIRRVIFHNRLKYKFKFQSCLFERKKRWNNTF